MGKKVREYKSGDFIFAKVKGYPAWPARVQRPNGKKYFVYFYGTGETANLPPNMIFDYVENKDKFLNKSVKRRDFNDGVKQIEYDFANNVPLEEVIGVPVEAGAEAPADSTADDSAIDATMEDSAMDATANDTAAEDANATQNEAAVEDSDDAGALVIDEGKTPAKGRKSKADAKPKEKDTPKAKEPKTPRGKVKKDDPKDKEDEKTADEELVSRSGRKIRPKRYIDEQTEDNTTLPSPAPKRRRGTSPPPEKEKADASKEKEKDVGKNEKSVTQFNVVKQSELEGLKEVFKPVDEDKDNILIAYLPSNTYAGIRLFQSRPRSFKNDSTRLQWDKQAARNALTLKMQLEREHISPESVQGQLVMDLNLTDEEKAALDKERETEEKKSRVNFLKTEMKLIELDAKIKTCLCLEKADTDLCLKLLDELLALEVKPLMLLKHPTCLETVKRMRAYVGNTPSWDLNESDALAFSKQAHKIRKKADLLYKHMKEHFQTPDGLSFWEYFSERVLVFKKATAQLNAGELLELVHEPAEMCLPNMHSMKAAIDQANLSVPLLPDSPGVDDEEGRQSKRKPSSAKSKKSPVAVTPSKSKRGRARKEEEGKDQSADAQKPEDDAVESEKVPEEAESVPEQNGPEKEKDQDDGAEESSKETQPESNTVSKDASGDVEMSNAEKEPDSQENSTENVEKEASPEKSEKEKQSKTDDIPENAKDADKSTEKTKDVAKPTEKTKDVDKPVEKSKDDQKTTEKSKDSDKPTEKTKDTDKSAEKSGNKVKKSKDDKSDSSEKDDEVEKKEKKNSKDEKSSNDTSKNSKDSGKEKRVKHDEKSEAKDGKSDEKDKAESGEPRAKRSRESKKTDPPSRSPAKRKSKF